jgi:phosphate transport system substrate-binding protein
MTRRTLLLLLAATACSRTSAAPTEASPRVLTGSGATLPYPLYARWASEYARVEPTVRINYRGVGSGAGIRQMSDGVVDFGATDEPMSDEQLRRAKGVVVHVPTAVGAVAIAYHLPEPGDLRLTGDLLADIFLGRITRWDDERLRERNAGRALPAAPITIVHRADGSGTTATFTAYLSKTSDAWRAQVGSGTSPRFPTGVGARGNEGVGAMVRSTPGAIGYLELAHARRAGLPVAHIVNRAGELVLPSHASIEAAVKSAMARVPDDLRLSIVDVHAAAAYPIAALSFVLLPKDSADRDKAEALSKFLWWAIHEGQDLAPPLDYARLPPELVRRGERVLGGLLAEGRPLPPAGG